MVERAILPDPVPLELILCDGISRDLLTGKLSILGLTGAIKVSALPARVTFTAFARLTNVRENIPLRFRIVDSWDNIIAETEEASLPKPADIMDEVVSMVRFKDIEFSQDGIFLVQLWTPRMYIMERRLPIIVTED